MSTNSKYLILYKNDMETMGFLGKWKTNKTKIWETQKVTRKKLLSPWSNVSHSCRTNGEIVGRCTTSFIGKQPQNSKQSALGFGALQ